MKTFQQRALLCAALWGALGTLGAADGATINFGSGLNQFGMEFVEIGNPGNAADTTGSPNPVGAVGYAYQFGKYEVSRDMVDKANAAGNLGITMENMTNHGGNGVNRPATGISWNEAARFVNWLNTSQNYAPAYKFALQPGDVGYVANVSIELWVSGDAGYNVDNPFRNSNARYYLPSMDEWYKAAFYDPNANAGAGGYWNYPTGSDTVPTGVASGGETTSGTAVFDRADAAGPEDIYIAGGLSPYGTMGQGGNAWEWMETEHSLMNDNGSDNRTLRGPSWGNDYPDMRSVYRLSYNPANGSRYVGFRVAAAPVPEPTSLLLAGLGAAGVLLLRSRFRKH